MEFEKLQAIIADVLNVPKDDITPETTFVRSLWELRKSSILRSTMKKQKRSQLCRMQLSR